MSTIHTKERFGYMWECPDFFNLDGQNILITCPQGVKQIEGIYENIYLSGYFLINDDYKNKDCEVNNFQILDRGFDFYAPQTFLDENNNRVIIGWMGVPDTEECHKNLTVEHGWQHCLTIPRELSFKDGKIYQKPHRSLDKLRDEKIEKVYESVNISDNLLNSNVNAYDAVIDIIDSKDFEFIISEGLSGRYENNKFILEFIGGIGRKIGGGRAKRTAALDNLKNIRILADTSSVEIFINDGEMVFSTRYYPDIYSFKVSGNLSLTLYTLNGFNIKF